MGGIVHGTALGVNLPIRHRYGEIWEWILNLATHTGPYGAGERGMIALGPYLRNVGVLLRHEYVLAASLAAGAVFLVVVGSKMRSDCLHSPVWRAVFAIQVAQAAQILAVAKQPASHYVIPALALTPALIILIATHLQHHPGPGRDRVAYAGAALLAVTLLLPILRVDARVWHNRRYREYSQRSAVTFGNAWAGNRYTKLIARVYGEE